MKLKVILLFLSATIFIAACNNGKPKVSEKAMAKKNACPEMKQNAGAAEGAEKCIPAFTGVVEEALNAASYTYVRLKTPDSTIWAAGPQTAVKIGDSVCLMGAMAMKDFKSATLKRTFELVYFVNSICPKKDCAAGGGSASGGACCPKTASAGGGMESIHLMKTPGASPSQSNVDFSGITRPAGGKTVAELKKNIDGLSGKTVLVRAKVSKVTIGILDLTWLHVNDGSGDVTVCTPSTNAKVGDLVLVKGTLVKNKTIGGGMTFPVLVDNATISMEKQ